MKIINSGKEAKKNKCHNAGAHKAKHNKAMYMVFAAVTALLFFLTITGCSAADISQQAGKNDISGAQPAKITVVLDWVPNTNHTGIYAARKLGYYAQEGLEVEIVQPVEGGSPDLIAAGKGEFGISYQEQVTYARTAEQPLPVIAVAAIIAHNTSGFASPVDRNIKSPKDFEGKKYGGWGSPMEEAMLKGLMDKFGGDYSKVEIINIGASDFFTSVTKDVDFAWIYYGWDGVAAEQKDFKIDFMLLQELDSDLDFYTPVIIASEKTLIENPGLVKSFLRATKKGYLYAIQNPEKAADILISEVPELDRNIVVASQEYLAGQYISDSPDWGIMKSATWETFSRWMYDNNLIPAKLEAEKAFTNDFLE